MKTSELLEMVNELDRKAGYVNFDRLAQARDLSVRLQSETAHVALPKIVRARLDVVSSVTPNLADMERMFLFQESAQRLRAVTIRTYS